LTLNDFYQLAVKLGMEKDPRDKTEIKKHLAKQKKLYEDLSKKEKQAFDKEKLTNPYSDTRIIHGDKKKQIKSVLVGVDIDTAEVLLADRLKQLNKKIDLIMSHHPMGRARANFYEVMSMHVDILNSVGVPVNVAEGLMNERIKEVERKIMPANVMRGVDAVRLLDIPAVCVHTPADNFVATYLQKLMDKQKPQKVSDILDILTAIPEYKQAACENTGPKIIAGTKDSSAGKIFVDMTGGTEGSKKIYRKLSQAGVGTIVGMHLSEGHLKNAVKEHINVVIAGHISSDTLGLNLLLDQLQKKSKFDVICCSGFNRIKRGR